MNAPIVPATVESIAHAARLLRRGLLIAFPTETVYGVGADASNDSAVASIFAAKGRPPDHPLIVHLADASALTRWARDVPEAARRLADAFWPGPLTLILPRAAGVADAITGGQASVGLRVPAHPVARALLAEFGAAIAAPSANRFGHVSPTTAAHVATDLGDKLALIVDGGPCEVGIESTIVAFIDGEPTLLRPGGVSVEALAHVLGHAPGAPGTSAPRAPGTLPSHYAPRTRALLVAADTLPAEAARRVGRGERVAVLARTAAQPARFTGAWFGASVDAVGYARELYAALRELDAFGTDVVLIETPPVDAAWLAVRDRLERACAGGDGDDRD